MISTPAQSSNAKGRANGRNDRKSSMDNGFGSRLMRAVERGSELLLVNEKREPNETKSEPGKGEF